MELAELKEELLGYMKKEEIVFQQVDDGRMEGISYGRLSLDASQPSVVIFGQFDDPCWEVVTIAHEVGHILNFREMERDEARDFFCTMLVAPSLGLGRISGGGQRLTLHSEVLASLKGLEVLKKIGISDEGLEGAWAMMTRLSESYWSKCERAVVDEVLQHPRVQELMG
jgi:hypothetical protein